MSDKPTLDYAGIGSMLTPPFRRLLAGKIFFVGLLLWVASMLIPAEPWPIWPHFQTAYMSMIIVLLGAVLPALEHAKYTDATELLTHLACVFYCITFVSAWWPVFMHPHRVTLWLYRLMSIGMFVSWADWLQRTGDSPFSAPGDVVWAMGSSLIAVSIWVVPPKDKAGLPMEYFEG